MYRGALSEIRLFSGSRPPKGWSFCQGQLLPIRFNQALFSLLGTVFGGDGRDTFALPNLPDVEGGNGGKLHFMICSDGTWPLSMDGFIGLIRLLAGRLLPDGWLPCDGRVVNVNPQNSHDASLINLLGNRYGGNGITSVGLPRLDPPAQAVTVGTLTVPQYVICTQGQDPPLSSGSGSVRGEVYLGEVLLFADPVRVPNGLVGAQGSSLPISRNMALFSITGSTFTAVPNNTTFQLPALAPLPAQPPQSIPYLIATDGYYPSPS